MSLGVHSWELCDDKSIHMRVDQVAKEGRKEGRKEGFFFVGENVSKSILSLSLSYSPPLVQEVGVFLCTKICSGKNRLLLW
jgi:hypothetical protein